MVSIKERFLIVRKYFMTMSLKHVQERFSDEFSEKSAPDKKSILHHIEKFNEQGSIGPRSASIAFLKNVLVITNE